ncbi:MAG: hypothetical protein RJA70_3137 [Pseudomonadota bacterium]|jgi:predicted enzyme related to lactoylglutathione lyase
MTKPIVHFEIWGPNDTALCDFYSANFGWRINADNPMQYGMTEAKSGESGINGGILKTPAQAPEGWPASGVTLYISVPSINPALAKIEKSGGKVIMPRTVIPGMVTFAQFSDPAGNIMGLVEDQMPAAATESKTAAKKTAAKKTAAKKTAAKKTAAKKTAAKKTAAKKG